MKLGGTIQATMLFPAIKIIIFIAYVKNRFFSM
jgi:hypothetical protein